MSADLLTSVILPSLLIQQALAIVFHFSAETRSDIPQVPP